MPRRRKRTPHQRKELRDAVLLTLTSGAFVTVGLAMLASGELLWGLACATFFGACAIVGIVMWVSAADPRRSESSGSAKVQVIALTIASLLMGAGCASVFVIALFRWDLVDSSTTILFPRAIALIAGGAGALFFGGGGVLLFVRTWKR